MKSNKLFALGVSALLAGVTLAACGAPQKNPGSSAASSEPGTSSVTPTSSPAESSDAKLEPKSGLASYVGESYAEKTKILGKLESYAVNNYLTGLPLYENGGYVMYNDRITKGTENYITGYGFSILRDGKITKDLDAETNAAYKRYLHNYEPSNPNSILGLNTDGSQVADLDANISGSYWDTKMNAAKNGYDWKGSLSTDDRPIPVVKGSDGNFTEVAGYDSNTLATSWKFHVRTGAEGGVAYRNASADASRKAFDGRYTTIEDYVTPFKVMLTKANGYYRGGELAAKTGTGAILGAADFYNGKATDISGIHTGHDSKGDYLIFELATPTNPFNAMYNLASGLYSPFPMEFWNLVTDNGANPTNFKGYNKDMSFSPVDNSLSVGPYYLETWEDSLITFKRNENWYESKADSNLYSIPGIHTAILPGVSTDSNLAFNEFLAGKLDSAGIPLDFLGKYKNDPRTTSVPGDSTFKLNINSCTKEQWVDKFGKNGSIAQTDEANYWDVKPWMSNQNFLDGLMFSIDRLTYAQNRGYVPSVDYFASAYMSDPENGISYDVTDEHKAALESYWGDDVAKTYGYSREIAIQCFKAAVEELVASGDIKLGTTENPTKISINMQWMYERQIQQSGVEIVKYITEAFNNEAVCGGKVKLVVNQAADAVWSDVYYKHLMVGQFDLGFGSISGNTLNPLNFMEVLKSNNSSGFTLNWGPDTSVIDDEYLDYDGYAWSFDTLWKAADSGVLLVDGKEVDPVDYTITDGSIASDGSFNFEIKYTLATSLAAFAADAAAGNLGISIANVYVYDDDQKYVLAAYDDDTGKPMDDGLVVDDGEGTIKVKVPKDIVDAVDGMNIEIHYSMTMNVGGAESTGSGYVSNRVSFPAKA